MLLDMQYIYLDDFWYNKQEKISAILQSHRKYTSIQIENLDMFGMRYYTILDHFKDSIKEISFGNFDFYSPVLLIDIFAMMQNLENLYIGGGTFPNADQYNAADYKNEGKILNEVTLGDPSFLSFLPDIKDLHVTCKTSRCPLILLKDLIPRKNLNELGITWQDDSEFPDISFGSFQFPFKLDALFMKQSDPENLLDLNQLTIGFIKCFAKSLKKLHIENYSFNFDAIQNLFDSMEVLERVFLSGKMELQSGEFLLRNFQRPKLKSLLLAIKDFEHPQFFNKFPNLENLKFCHDKNSTYMVDSAARDCRNIENLYIWEFDAAFENATFRDLLELTVCKVSQDFLATFELFLLRHGKLTTLDLAFVMNTETLWKLPTILPNLKNIRFFTVQEFTEADLTKLLLSWPSIKKVTFITPNHREFDLTVVLNNLQRPENPLFIYRYVDMNPEIEEQIAQ